MRSLFATGVALFACAGPVPDSDEARCDTRLRQAEASGWTRTGHNVEGDAEEHTYDQPLFGHPYHRSVRCEQDLVTVDVEWASFTNQPIAREHFERLRKGLSRSCAEDLVEDSFSPSPRPEWPAEMPRVSFSSSLEWAEMVACIEPTERRVLSLSQVQSHDSEGKRDTTWSIEVNRQPTGP